MMMMVMMGVVMVMMDGTYISCLYYMHAVDETAVREKKGAEHSLPTSPAIDL